MPTSLSLASFGHAQIDAPLAPCTPSCDTRVTVSSIDVTNTREHETICSNKAPLSDICNRQTPTSDVSRVPLHVKNGTPLTAEEVLLYALMIVSFPTGTFCKKHSAEKYDNIVQVIHQVTGVNYSSPSVRNCFHQVGNNPAKGIRKT